MTRRGFTLVELLAAVFISSIVVAAAFTLMTGTTADFDDESERRKLKSNIRIAELLIQRDISRTSYMASYDTAKEEINPLWSDNVAQKNFIAFNYYNPQNEFSAFTFIASLSDFLEFKVDRVDGNTLCIQPQLTMPLTAADIGNLGTDANPVAQNADEYTFWSAFTNTFNNVNAIAIQNPAGRHIITEVDHIEMPDAPDDSNCAFKIVMKPGSGSRPSIPGFEGTSVFSDCNIFPIVAVTYFVYQDTNDNDQDGFKENRLIRCLNNPLALSTDFNSLIQTPGSNCIELIDNLQYFEVFPLTNTGNFDSSFFRNLADASNTKGINTKPGAKAQHNAWNGVTISQLRGVYFRFGAASPMPLASDVAQNVQAGERYPAVARIQDTKNQAHFFAVEHLQGVAPFRIPFNMNVLQSTATVSQTLSH